PEPAADVVVAAEQADDSDDGDDAEESGSRRRRRRGGRRRRRGEAADGEGDDTAAEQAAQDAEDTAEQADEDAEDGEDDSERGEEAGGSTAGSRRRRRRRRRAGDGSGDGEQSGDDPERTVVKVREPRKQSEREPSDEVQSIKGSTRLEAKKQRRREGREQGRRRVPIITEAEFLARREAVERVMVVRQNGDRTQIGVLEDNVLVEHYVNKEQSTSYVGNVYLGKVQNVLPSMEAAFIDIGKGRNAVLYAGEVNFEALGMAHGPRRIESALKSGQSVLVQVTKDPIGHKGARLTSQVSLPGRYLVYVPEGSMTGISRKLPDTERARLKTILKKIVPEDAGVIVRTAAEGASEDELRRDVERLQAQWSDIQKKAKSGNAPTLLYGEPDMTVRVVRDIFNEDFSKVIVSGDEAWQTVHGYVAHVAPDLTDRLQRWTSEVDVFATYRIDEQLAKALDRKVWLPSGGSLVIDKTEAMVVVDVNTGKFTGQGGNLEETVTRNNLEAAEEIVRQLRLRDLGGIVVIDFIDMVLESNRDLVLRRLLECLGRDRTKHQVAEVTSLGLVQMTRKRVGQGLLESFSETCVHCNGRGVIVHMDQASAAGGGGKRKKRGRGGAETPEHEHDHELVQPSAPVETETEAEVAAEAAAPVALSAPAFEPDEELYSSVAEAEAAAGRGRSRRRASRRASAPAGAPRGEAARSAAPAAESAVAAYAEETDADVRRSRPRAAAEVHAEPVAVEDPVVEAPPAIEAPAVAEASAEPVAAATSAASVEEAATAPVEEAAPKGRTRRRATRRVSAPAGAPEGAEAAVVTVTEPAAPAAAAEPTQPVESTESAEPVSVPAAETPAPADADAAPARPRRRAVRKATAPTASEDTAVVVVPSGTAQEASGDQAPEASGDQVSGEQVSGDQAPGDQAPTGDDIDGESAAPVKKAAARKTAKKATAKKAATTATKKTAAKKTTAKKTAAKKVPAKKVATKKTAAKKTAAAEQTLSSVSATTED
ncbi:Rne/Rng family ribonuclease, partial [Streptomyces sp. NPDC059477]|uniref:Rne/Rng family ribonuclease n=1 Tax=Streptomyces sp. NPDC059477 TaxID=3346847 RepID=UPI0036A1FE81